jgi:hypothetical protein
VRMAEEGPAGASRPKKNLTVSLMDLEPDESKSWCGGRSGTTPTSKLLVASPRTPRGPHVHADHKGVRQERIRVVVRERPIFSGERDGGVICKEHGCISLGNSPVQSPGSGTSTNGSSSSRDTSRSQVASENGEKKTYQTPARPKALPPKATGKKSPASPIPSSPDKQQRRCFQTRRSLASTSRRHACPVPTCTDFVLHSNVFMPFLCTLPPHYCGCGTQGVLV